MDKQLKYKVDDFTEWASTAFEHFNNNRFADALTNVRKSGEAACKLIIIHKYPFSLGESKIAQKGYKELINLLISENLIPRKVVNLLETFQIYGNIATHDTQVLYDEAEYGNIALRLLVGWLFEEYLNIDIPLKLTNFINIHRSQKEKLERVDALQIEMQNIQKKSKNLEKELKASQQQSRKDAETTQALKKELDIAILKVEELESSRQKTSQLHRKLQLTLKEKEQLKIELQKFKQKETTSASLHKTFFNIIKNNKKKIAIAAGILLLVGVIAIIWNYPFWQHSQKENKPLVVTEEKPFTVLILPFSVLQDNPNIIVKLEQVILNRLIQKSEAKKMYINVIYRPKKDKPAPSYPQALEAGKKQKADIVIFGEIYEQASGDSVQTCVKYVLVYKDTAKQIQGETGIKSFSKLTDIRAGNLQTEIECVVDMAIAYNFSNKGKYSEALIVLNEIDTFTNEYYSANVSLLKADCYNFIGRYIEAKNELIKTLEYYPEDAYNQNYLGDILIKIGQYDKAEKAYKKAVELDSKPHYLLDYADLLATDHFKDYNMSKSLVLSALQKDSSNAIVYFYLAELEVIFRNYEEAKTNYLKAIELNPHYTSAKKNLAKLLANHFDELKKAVSYLYEVIKDDSTDYIAHHLLGEIFTRTRIKDAEKAQKHFQISEKLQTSVGGGTYFGLALAAQEKNDFKTAEKYYLKTLALDSTNIIVYLKFIQLYHDFKRYDQEKFYLDKAYKLDSLNYHVLYDYGIFYGIAENTKYYNEKKAMRYLEKALKIIPSDPFVLANLGAIYYNDKKYVKAKKCFLNFYIANPNSYEINAYLGSIYEIEENFTLAKQYYEKAISINSNNPLPYIGLSFILLESPIKDYNLAIHYAQKVAELDPKIGEYHYKIAKVFYITGKLNKAKEHYYTAIQLDPNMKDKEFENSLYKNQ